jgi:hypothetical protein
MQCANPLCGAESHYFRNGSLHWIDRGEEPHSYFSRGRALKLVWLCIACCEAFVVQPWRAPGEQIQRRAAPAVPCPKKEPVPALQWSPQRSAG